MKRLAVIFALATLMLAGCHRHDHDGHGHAREPEAAHGDDAQSFSGATYKEGTGITLLAQTKQVLGIQTAEAEERKLARRVRWLARVYDRHSHALARVENAPLEDALASGTMAAREADVLKVGVQVELSASSGQKLQGTIVDVSKSLSPMEVEVVTRLEGGGSTLPAGAFLRAEAKAPMEQAALAVPKEALIRGAETNHVYVVNGDAYLRTDVEIGVESEGFVEIREGVLAGDSVVTQGALDLWLIELRAVKGGQGCCPAPPARTRK